MVPVDVHVELGDVLAESMVLRLDGSLLVAGCRGTFLLDLADRRLPSGTQILASLLCGWNRGRCGIANVGGSTSWDGCSSRCLHAVSGRCTVDGRSARLRGLPGQALSKNWEAFELCSADPICLMSGRRLVGRTLRDSFSYDDTLHVDAVLVHARNDGLATRLVGMDSTTWSAMAW